jgi:hypothetical protein
MWCGTHPKGIPFVSGPMYNSLMTTKYKPASLDELITIIYEDNYSHIEFMENMNGGDCDCNIHSAMNLIESYM